MKRAFSGCPPTAVYLMVIFALTGCSDLTLVERPYQRLLIDDFSAPIHTALPPYDHYPNSLTLLINVTITKSIILTVDQLGGDKEPYTIRRDTLMAGTYANKRITGDHYSRQAVELTVKGDDSAEGSLTIEWYRQ